jgi:hypothetical protein
MHEHHHDRSAAAAIFVNETYFVDTPRIMYLHNSYLGKISYPEEEYYYVLGCKAMYCHRTLLTFV